MMLKTILFDLDGTIIDSAVSIGSILNNMRNEKGLSPLAIDHYRKWVSLGAIDLVSNALEVGPGSVENHLDDFRKRYSVYKTSEHTIYPNVIQAIGGLRNMGIRMGICSNKPTHLCRKVLEDTSLDLYFSSVVGGDRAGKSKPAREPIDFALRDLNHNGGIAILVGDSSVDQKAASATGIPFIFFSGGYDDGVELASNEDSIESMRGLIPLLKAKGWIH